MTKETERRLIRTLEFLKEPQGSTIPTIVKAMNGEGPHVSLKRIVQTLRGCLENGIVKVSDGRVKLKQIEASNTRMSDDSKVGDVCGRQRSECKPPCSMRSTSRCPGKKMTKHRIRMRDEESGYTDGIPMDEGEEGEGGGEEGGGGEENGNGSKACPECPVCPKKKKKKPKCPKPKPKCPKKKKPKCPKKKKPKCPKPKPKPKKCGKKPKIQPYCKKKKKCDD